jgi:hypothetical protein
MGQPDDRHFLAAQALGRLHAPVTGDDLERVIDQYGITEAIPPYGGFNLTHLLR